MNINFKIRLLIPIVLVSITCRAQEFTIGMRDTLFSHILNQERNFIVYLPPSYYTVENQEYPVLYILDGDYNFHYVSGLMELEGAISQRIPEMILIAISGQGTDTYRYNCKPDIQGVKDKGNADTVARFIAEELIPYVDKHYKTAKFKILSGHSLGGLFVINTALNHPQLFNDYIAISPSLWWEGNAINRIAREKINDDFNTEVYISLGFKRNMGVDSFLAVATSSILKNKYFIYGILLIFILLAIILTVQRQKYIVPVIIGILGCGIFVFLSFFYYPEDENFIFKRFGEENHNSVGEPTYRWALEDIFSTWRKDQLYFTTTEEFIKHYNRVKATYGNTFNIPSVVLGYTSYFMQDSVELNKFRTELKAGYPEAYIDFLLIRSRQLVEKKPEKSEKMVRKVLQSDPYNFKALNYMAGFKLKSGNVEEAYKLITRAIEKAQNQQARQWQINQLIETELKVKELQVTRKGDVK